MKTRQERKAELCDAIKAIPDGHRTPLDDTLRAGELYNAVVEAIQILEAFDTASEFDIETSRQVVAKAKSRLLSGLAGPS